MNDVIDRNEFVCIIEKIKQYARSTIDYVLKSKYSYKIDDQTASRLRLDENKNFTNKYYLLFTITKLDTIELIKTLYFNTLDNDKIKVQSMLLDFIDKHNLLADLCRKETEIYNFIKNMDPDKQKYYQIEQQVLVF